MARAFEAVSAERVSFKGGGGLRGRSGGGSCAKHSVGGKAPCKKPKKFNVYHKDLVVVILQNILKSIVYLILHKRYYPL